ncbi:MAG: hypothetical protein AAFY88_04720 [Acidobacteriota bacterium]
MTFLTRLRRHVADASPTRRCAAGLRYGACALLIGAVAAAPAHADPLAFSADGVIEAVTTADGWVLRSEDGDVPLPFEKGADVHVQHVEATGSGWLLSATSRTDGGSRLVVVRRGPEGALAQPVPATSARVLLQPTVLADPATGEPHVIAWIEGRSPRESSVRAARWNGAGWDETVVLAPQGPGTQIALDAARLDDESVLAVWSAFDGEDDEVVWSVTRDGVSWSAPTAISKNAVPDVTPTVVAVDGGAVVAWSGFDGNDYRVWTSRFDGESWSEARRHGERGSVFPTFGPQKSAGPVLVYQQTAPAAWRVSRLDGDATEASTVSLESGKVRPVVLGVDDDGVTLRATSSDGAAKATARRVPWSKR